MSEFQTQELARRSLQCRHTVLCQRSLLMQKFSKSLARQSVAFQFYLYVKRFVKLYLKPSNRDD